MDNSPLVTMEAFYEDPAFLRTLIKASPDLVVLLAPDGRILFANERATEILGCERVEEIIGVNVLTFVPPEFHQQAQEDMGETLRVRGNRFFEYPIVRLDGSTMFAAISTSILDGIPGLEPCFLIIARDISTQKSLEQANQTLLEKSLAGYFVMQEDRVAYVNKVFTDIIGYEPHEVISVERKKLHQIVHPDDRQMIEARVQMHAAGTSLAGRYQFRIVRKDGAVRWLEALAAESIYHGRPAYQVSMVDLTEQKNIEQSFVNLLEKSLAGVAIFQGDYIVYMNKNFSGIIGYDLGEIGAIKKDFLVDHIHPDDRPMVLERMRNRASHHFAPETNQYRILHKDGEVRWVKTLTTESVYNGRPAYQVSMVDLTEQKNLEEAYRRILDTSLAGVLLLQGRDLVYVNKIYSDISGFEPQELIGQNSEKMFDFIHPDDREKIRGRILAHRAGESLSGRYEFRILRKDGKVRWLEAQTEESTHNGEPAYQVSVVDLTERKLAEEALRETMTRYQALVEAAHEGIYIIDRENHFLYINKHGAELLGSTPEKVIGQSRESYVPGHRARKHILARQKVIETGEAMRVDDHVPTSQGLRWFSTWLVPLRDESGEVTSVLGVARDIDERKKLELQLKRMTRELEKRVSERTAELVESQQHLQSLTRQIVNAQEEERRRVSRELHDEAGQALISLKLNLAAMLDELPLPYPDLHERLQGAIDQVDQTMNQVRTLAHSLRPPVLDVAGINLSLEEYCYEFSQRARIPVEYHGMTLFDVPEETSISLFRFLQEALTNIIKHAQASSVQVELAYADQHIRLTVHDDGRGFRVKETQPGVGLEGMQERLALLRGSLQIISSPGQGTQLVAEIPWERQATG